MSRANIPAVLKIIGKERHWCCGAVGCRGKLAQLPGASGAGSYLVLGPNYMSQDRGIYTATQRAKYRLPQNQFAGYDSVRDAVRELGKEEANNRSYGGLRIEAGDLPAYVRCPSCAKVGIISAINGLPVNLAHN